MKEFSLFEYLQSFGVDKNFFDISSRTSIDFVNGELGFKSKNSGLLSKFKKQFIPLTSVFPENRKNPGFLKRESRRRFDNSRLVLLWRRRRVY